MRIVVDHIPKSCKECLFSRRGANMDDSAYTCACSLLKAERIIYEWETLWDCPLIEYKTIKSIRGK